MSTIKKNKQKSIRRKKSVGNKPVQLPYDPRAVKKTAELNAMLEKAIFLPS